MLVKNGLFKGSLIKVIYLCGDCLARLKEDKKVRKHLRIRYRKMRELPLKTEPRIVALREAATSVVNLSLRKLSLIEDMINEHEARLRELRRKLAERYGSGYLTVKTVKNRAGKHYSYIVYRTKDGKEIYVKDELGKETLEVRNKLRELREKRNHLIRRGREAHKIEKVTELMSTG